MKKIIVGMMAIGMLTLGNAANAGTLENVQKRGEVKCGALGSIAGFSSVDDQGKWTGLDSDTCRAMR